MFDYRLYGLVLRSDFPLPAPQVHPRDNPDVRLLVGTGARFEAAGLQTKPIDPDQWFAWRQLADGEVYLRWSRLCEFIVSADGSEIFCRRSESAPGESFYVYLLGQVLSFSLVKFGIDPLHGTAVDVDGGAVVFVGDCGQGKSTLAAALLARGYPVLTDDLSVVVEHNGTWTIQPGVPRIKLFPAVQRDLLGAGVAGTPMNSGTTKLVVPLNERQSVRRPLPVRALYVLGDSEAAGAPQPAAQIEELSGREAFLEVTRAAFNLLVKERERLAGQFELARRIAAAVPVRRLTYTRSLSALPAVCDRLLEDLRS